MKKSFYGLVILVIVFMMAACSSTIPDQTGDAGTSDSNNAVDGTGAGAAEDSASEVAAEVSGNGSASETHLFDGAEAKAGDVIAGLKIANIQMQIAETMPEFGPLGTVTFEGEAEVGGTYEFYKDHEFLGEGVLFRVDDESAGSLPKLKNDERNVWFVFENPDEAAELFGTSEGKGEAIIRINNYLIRYEPKEVYNTAVLIDVINK